MQKYFSLIRISNWIKNTFIFVPLVFSKTLMIADNFILAIFAFFAFSAASSIIYIFNDICDIESDKNHPQKRNRPLAAGRISLRKAYSVIAVFFIILLIVVQSLPSDFSIIIFLFLLLNFLYSIKLKNIVLLDIFSIAGGFILRVIGGAIAISVLISDWLILTTLFLSLFLAVMKRRSELNISTENRETRKVLLYYSNNFIDQISTITAGGVIICYALYTVSSHTVEYFGSDFLIYTTLFVIYGIFRYMFLVLYRNKGEDPTKEIFMDVPMLINLVLYTLSIFFIVYI